MDFSRIMFGGASSLVLSMFLALQTNSADVNNKVARLTLACTTTVNVDPDQPQGVDLADAYICPGTTVTWAANGHKFHVFFKKHKCPFSPNCKNITDGNPTSGTVRNFSGLIVFEYGIIVDEEAFDPHVVGGGGHIEYSTDESKRESEKR